MGYMEENGMEMQPKLTLTLCDKTLRTEVSEDYTLPDYQPEIRRILHVIPTVLPPAKYVGNGNVEWNGAVDYQVFYVGGDGGIYTLSLSSDYGGQIPLEGTDWLDLNEGVTVLVTTASEGVNTRVSGPRKLNLRCRLCSKIRAYGHLPLEVREIGVRDHAALERHYRESGQMAVFGGVSDGIGCTEEILGIEENTRVISAVAEALVENVRKEADGLHVTGEVGLCLMVEKDHGTPETILRKLPLDGVMDWDGSGRSVCVRGVVSDMQLQVEEGKILCQLSIVLEGRSMEEAPLVYVDDAYSLDRESECRYGEYRIPTVLACENGNFSQSERIPVSEANIPEGASILQSFATAYFEECKVSDGTCQLCGKSRYVLLCEREGEYSTLELVLPIRYEVKDVSESPESFDATASMMGSRVRVEGDTLCIDTEWAVTVDLVGGRNVTVLREIQLGEPMADRDSAMTVYYPSEGDTTWSVAKKYHIPAESISEGAAYYFF